VSDVQLEGAIAEPALVPSRRPRPFGLVLLALLVASCLAVAVVTVVTRPAPHHGGPAARTANAGASPNLARARVIHALLRRRSEAIVHHNRAEFAATLDPASRGFRRTQLRMFANLARVHFAGWSYTFVALPFPFLTHTRSHYHAPIWSPFDFRLHYRIAGFDRTATDLRQYPTFVDRGGHWYLGSLSDFKSEHNVSSTDLWDYAPVRVVRRPAVLVLGPPSEVGTMSTVAEQMHAAIPKVDRVVGRHWARRVVVLVPSTQREMGLLADDHRNLDQIAALTSSEIGTVHGRTSPVGDRVTLNPHNWSKLGDLGSSIVLTHELTHVATRTETGPSTPTWLSEGFADYVGFLDTGIPTVLVAAELATRVRAGHAPRRLPGDHVFERGGASLPVAYESGWLACRLLAQRYGQSRLVRFYREVGRSVAGPQVAVKVALHRRFGLTVRRFTSMWRHYVRSALA
jgi:hypothetical protein